MEKIKVLFICHGNICRSTMAEMVMKDIVRKNNLESEFFIDSSATSNEEIGNNVHYGTRSKLKEVGIRCDNHFAKRMTKADYDKFDFIIGMDSANIRNIKYIAGGDSENKVKRLLSYANIERDIADPWYTGNFDETFDDVLLGCTKLFENIKNSVHLK